MKKSQQAKKSQTLEKLHNQDSFFSHANAKLEADLRVKNSQDGLIKNNIKKRSDTVQAEVKNEYAKLWANNDVENLLLQNARRYDISKNEELNDQLRPELLRLAVTDSHRPFKSRRNYIINASKSYKRAAEKMAAYRTNKEVNRAWKMVESGESAIMAVYEAEKSLIKAGGIYDQKEKLRVERNSLKCNNMLQRFFEDCLKREDLTEKERRKLEQKLAKVRREIQKSNGEIMNNTFEINRNSEKTRDDIQQEENIIVQQKEKNNVQPQDENAKEIIEIKEEPGIEEKVADFTKADALLEKADDYMTRMQKTLELQNPAVIEGGLTRKELSHAQGLGLDYRCYNRIKWSKKEKKDEGLKKARLMKLKVKYVYEQILKDIEKEVGELKQLPNSKETKARIRRIEDEKKQREKQLKDLEKTFPELKADFPLLMGDKAQGGSHFDQSAPGGDYLAMEAMVKSDSSNYNLCNLLDKKVQFSCERGVELFKWDERKNKATYEGKVMTPVNANPKEPEQIIALDRLYNSKEIRKVRDLTLFPEGKVNADDVLQMQSMNNCYLASALYQLAKTNPDYIKNTLVKDYGQEGKQAVVRLFDVYGNPVDIVVNKTRIDPPKNENDEDEIDYKRPLWINMVEKAAVYLVGQQPGEFSTGAGYRQDERKKDDVKYSKGMLSREDINDGNELLGVRLLTGAKPISFRTRDEGNDAFDYYPNSILAKKYDHEEGDKAIAKLLMYIRAGKTVISSTCKQVSSQFYDLMCDGVNLLKYGVQPKHTYAIIGEGEPINGQRTIRIRDPKGKTKEKDGFIATNGYSDIPFHAFKKCFSEIFVVDYNEVTEQPEKQEIK